MNALPEIDGSLETLATSIGWDAASRSRLRFGGEESLSSLLEMNEDEPPGPVQREPAAVRGSEHPDAGCVGPGIALPEDL